MGHHREDRMVDSFAGGIRDAEGLRGYLEVAPEDVVAVDLTKGSVLWRRERVGRPIAATASRLLTLDRDGNAFVLRFLDAATGVDVGRVKDFGMPDWAAQAGTERDALQTEASQVPTGIRLAWRLRRPYRGGAPPPRHIEAQAREESTGAIVVDVNSGQVAPADAAAPAAARMAPADLGPHAKPEPDVYALDRVGDRLFALRAQAGPDQAVVTLEARRAGDGSVLWRVPLTQAQPGRPTPQRK